MDSVVHFEIPVDDVSRAGEFYSKAFGWGINPVEGMPYTMVNTTEISENHMPKAPGAINGGMLKRQDCLQSPVITIAVDDIDEALTRLADLGGEVARPKHDVGGFGFSAYFNDTEGNVIGLFQATRRPG